MHSAKSTPYQINNYVLTILYCWCYYVATELCCMALNCTVFYCVIAWCSSHNNCQSKKITQEKVTWLVKNISWNKNIIGMHKPVGHYGEYSASETVEVSIQFQNFQEIYCLSKSFIYISSHQPADFPLPIFSSSSFSTFKDWFFNCCWRKDACTWSVVPTRVGRRVLVLPGKSSPLTSGSKILAVLR